ncbi:hypothetical protein P8876_20890, partial [Bacillus haynesii]|nr:hypothetical protein [Bacillus haynesii]
RSIHLILTTPLFDQQTCFQSVNFLCTPYHFAASPFFMIVSRQKMKALTFSIIATISRIDKSFFKSL